MGIGSMRDRVTFKVPVHSSVPGGGYTTVYEPVFSDWTKVSQTTISRQLTDNQIVLQSAITFRVRYRETDQPDKSMLIEFEGADYAINSPVEVDNRKRYWQIVAVTNGDAAPQQTT